MLSITHTIVFMASNKKNKVPKYTPFAKDMITLADFRAHHYNGFDMSTDGYYVWFANKLFKVVRKFFGNDDRFDSKIQRKLVLTLTCYVEDLVSGQGVWQAFVSLHKKKYGRELPFFETDDEYYSREFPCLQAVRFLIWYVLNSTSSDTLLNPCNPAAELLALAIFPMIEEGYDEAPDTVGRIRIVPEEKIGVPVYYQVRNLCMWLVDRCYLTKVADSRTLADNLTPLAEKFGNLEDDDFEHRKAYIADAFLPFNVNIGPLAIRAYEWLAEIMDICHDPEEEEFMPAVNELKSLPYSFYEYVEIGKDSAVLCNLDRERMEMSAYTMPDGVIPSHVKAEDSAFMSLVYFDGKWMLNGIGAQGLSGEAFDKAYALWEEKKSAMESSFAALMKGLRNKRIGVCANCDEYLAHFPTAGKQEDMDIPEDIRDCDNLLYFVNTDSTVTILPNWGDVVKLRGNKYYDKKEAAMTGLQLIMDHDLATSEMRQYIIDNNLIPDAAMQSVESEKAGKELFQNNMRFLNDYMSRDSMEVFSSKISE